MAKISQCRSRALGLLKTWGTKDPLKDLKIQILKDPYSAECRGTNDFIWFFQQMLSIYCVLDAVYEVLEIQV